MKDLPLSKTRQLKKPREPNDKQLDDKFRQLVRLLNDCTCQICGTAFPYEMDGRKVKVTNQIQVMHIIGRSSKKTRWSLKNVIMGCASCHLKFDNKWNQVAIEYFRADALKQLGYSEDDLAWLRHTAQEKGKPDRVGIEIWIDQQIDKLLGV